MRRLALALAICVATLCLARADARADALTVRTMELGAWGDAIAVLQADVHSQGRVLHVAVVDDSGRPSRCGEYRLALDAVASRAFALGACDEVTSTTPLRLIDRAALFARGDIVSRPLSAGIFATETRTGGAVGGATRTAGSDVTCSVAVRPYLVDLERGTRVYLAPGRFRLRPLASGVDVRTDGPTFWLHSGSRATLTIDYQVVDTARRDEVVLTDRAVLQCAATPLGPTPRGGDAAAYTTLAPIALTAAPVRVVSSTCQGAPALIDGLPNEGSTLNASRRPLYRLALDAPTTLRMHLTSDFGGEIDFSRGCPGAGGRVATSRVFGGGDGQLMVFDLPPGVYFVSVIDADIHAHVGDYSVETEAQSDYLAQLVGAR